MKELEQYIRSHANEFDVMEPLPGHEERFLARLEQAQLQLSDELTDFDLMPYLVEQG